MRAALAAAAALLLAVLWPAAAAASDTVAFTIKDARITESSGLAADPAAQAYWTINDSGSGGVAYAVTSSGKVKGTLNYRATPRDVEAIALDGERLYVADIGDNTRSRDFVTVYFFEHARANGLTVGYRAYDFRYPDGAHDAETLLVDPKGRLYLVTKGVTGGVYAAPAKPSRVGVNKLKKVGDAPGLITDGTYLPGSERIALLSYDAVVVLDAKSYSQVDRATIPRQPQAESLTVSLDGRSLLVGSEGKRSKVFAMPVPGTAPTPTATPSDPGGSADIPEDDTDPNAGLSRAGTFLAVGLAAFVAVVAGTVVVLVRRP